MADTITYLDRTGHRHHLANNTEQSVLSKNGWAVQKWQNLSR